MLCAGFSCGSPKSEARRCPTSISKWNHVAPPGLTCSKACREQPNGATHEWWEGKMTAQLFFFLMEVLLPYFFLLLDGICWGKDLWIFLFHLKFIFDPFYYFSQEIEDDICKIGLFIGENERKLELFDKQKGDIEQSIEKLQGQSLVCLFVTLSSPANIAVWKV